MSKIIASSLSDLLPVLTANRGWTTHGDLKINDYVFSSSGNAIRVESISKKTLVNCVVEISNGELICCNKNQKWTIYDRRQGKQRIKDTEWIFDTKLINPNGGKKRYNIQLLPVGRLEYPEQTIILDPYTLGAWLGDGSRAKACISGDKKDFLIIKRILTAGYQISAECVHSITGVITTYFKGVNFRPQNGTRLLLAELRAIGVEYDKYIPCEYIENSFDIRIQLLAGLIDTDGHCDKVSRIRFTTADAKLRDTVYELALTLGYRPYIREEQPKLSSSGIQGRKVYWVVGFQPTDIIPCALKRKLVKRIAKQRKLSIANCYMLSNEQQGHSIRISSHDGIYLVGRKLIPVTTN